MEQNKKPLQPRPTDSIITKSKPTSTPRGQTSRPKNSSQTQPPSPANTLQNQTLKPASSLPDTNKKRVRITKGAKNLTVLALTSIMISVALTVVSLAIYHYSGDIYLDRSRPGYLPDQEEISSDESEEETEYILNKSGALTKKDLDEYLENLNKELRALDEYTDPFSAEALSNEHFGL